MTGLADRSPIAGPPDGAGMHPMTATALRALQSARGADGIATAAAALPGVVTPGDPGESRHWPGSRRLAPHLRALWDSRAAPEMAVMDTVPNQAAICRDKFADHPGGLEVVRAALQLVQARLPEARCDIALGCADLGGALMHMGDLHAARAALERTVALTGAHRPGSADASNSCDLQGGVLPEIGWCGDRAALALRRGPFGRRGAPVAGAPDTLAGVRDAQVGGSAFCSIAEDPERGVTSGGCATGPPSLGSGASWLKTGRADRAEPFLEEALALRCDAGDGDVRHPARRNVAGWLVSCRLVRARAGENQGIRKVQAKRPCAEFGLDFEGELEHAARHPHAPAEDGAAG